MPLPIPIINPVPLIRQNIGKVNGAHVEIKHKIPISQNNMHGIGHSETMKKKSLPHNFDFYVLLFFIAAFAGWLWEVLLFFFTKHGFINRGVYEGPYLPIYGVGGLLLCMLLYHMKKKPLPVFLLSMSICTVLEYLTSLFLERRWGIRWWDYSGHFLNLNGRVCLLGAVFFGLGGTALVCLFLPFYEKMYSQITPKWRRIASISLLLVFIADGAWCAMHPNTGTGISFSSGGSVLFR